MPERFRESLPPTLAATAIVGALAFGAHLLHGGRADGAGLFDLTRRESKPTVYVQPFAIPSTTVGSPAPRVETNRLQSELVSALAAYRLVDVRLDAGRDPLHTPGTPSRGDGAEFRLEGTIDLVRIAAERRALPYTERTEHVVRGAVSLDFHLVDASTGNVVVSQNLGLDLEEDAIVAGAESEQRVVAAFAEELERSAAEEIARRIATAIAPVRVTSVDGDRVEVDHGASAGFGRGQLLEVLPAAQRSEHLRAGAAARKLGARQPIGIVRLVDVADDRASGSMIERTADVHPGMLCLPAADWEPSATPRPDPLADR